MTSEKAIIELKKISNKLKNVRFGGIRNQYTIKKDGNKLGRRKYIYYSNMRYRYLHLKTFVNSQYGIYNHGKEIANMRGLSDKYCLK